jgi:hypothetical protein
MLRTIPILLAAGLVLAAPASASPRSFGVYVDPWHVADWAAGVGAPPAYLARFEAFSRGATLDSFLAETERQGLRRVLVSWEPWRPVPDELGVREQFRPQPGYRNADIAAGAQDDYIVRFAQSLATFSGRVDLRYAHEMNGTWYPWSHDPVGYRRAWRHVVRLVRSQARNVRFVWSVNPSLFVSNRRWRRSVRVYWPGRRFVDEVGSTMINFGGVKEYPVDRFTPRLRALRQLFRKPVRPAALAASAGSPGAAHAMDPVDRLVPAPQPRPDTDRGDRAARLGRAAGRPRRRGAPSRHARARRARSGAAISTAVGISTMSHTAPSATHASQSAGAIATSVAR